MRRLVHRIDRRGWWANAKAHEQRCGLEDLDSMLASIPEEPLAVDEIVG